MKQSFETGIGIGAALWFFIAAILIAIFASGCGLSLLQRPNGADIACVVRYAKVSPHEWTGFDGCGNVWRMVQTDTTAVEPGLLPDDGSPTVGVECEIISDDGRSMIPIHCPASGDTLAVVRRSQ